MADAPARPAETDPPGETLPAVGSGTLPLRRILIVHTQRIGDVVCATPLFTALRRRFPRAHLAALIHRPADSLLEGHPDLDEILVYDRKSVHRSLAARLRLIGELRARQFDWALAIHAASSVAFALAYSGIPWRTCVWRYGDRERPAWAAWYHQHLRQERDRGDLHEVEHNLHLLRQLGVEVSHDGLRLPLPPEERERTRALLRDLGREESRPLALLHPGHGGGRQEWPPEHYAELGSLLAALGWQVGVTGRQREAGLAARVAGAMSPAPLLLAGRLHLRQLVAALADSRLFVSVPTGPMHLAAAVRTPVLALCGPSHLRIDVTRFAPYGTRHRILVSPQPCLCPSSRNCADPVCLRAITPESVLRAALELTGGERA